MIKNIVVVIPVAIGNRPVPDFEKEFPDEVVIKANKTDNPRKIADKIQDKLVSGRCIHRALKSRDHLSCFTIVTSFNVLTKVQQLVHDPRKMCNRTITLNKRSTTRLMHFRYLTYFEGFQF